MTPKQRRGADRPQAVPDRGLRDARGAELDAGRLGWALVPLRLFLGVTFVYGGIQKLSDPGFLHPGAPTYIGTQLRGFAHATPGGFLLRAFAIPHPALSGVGVALVEIAVGLLVCAGLLTRAAAAVGLALNLLLFLTNSWHTYPYFLGSDIVFVFAWLPFVLVGAARQPTLEAPLRRVTASRATAPVRPPARSAARGVRARPADGAGDELTRLSVIGAVAAATAAIAGLSVLLRGRYRPPRSLTASRARAAATTSTTLAARRAPPPPPAARRAPPPPPVCPHRQRPKDCPPEPSSSAPLARFRLGMAPPTRIRVMAGPTSSSDRPMELWSPTARCAPTPDALLSTGRTDRLPLPRVDL